MRQYCEYKSSKTMTNTKTKEDQHLILSCVRALQGEVTSSLRSVSAEFRYGKIIWQCVFDSEATDDDFDLVSSAAGEVIADFNDYGLEEIIIKVAFPEKMKNLDNLIYLRHENNYYKD